MATHCVGLRSVKNPTLSVIRWTRARSLACVSVVQINTRRGAVSFNGRQPSIHCWDLVVWPPRCEPRVPGVRHEMIRGLCKATHTVCLRVLIPKHSARRQHGSQRPPGPARSLTPITMNIYELISGFALAASRATESNYCA